MHTQTKILLANLTGSMRPCAVGVQFDTRLILTVIRLGCAAGREECVLRLALDRAVKLDFL